MTTQDKLQFAWEKGWQAGIAGIGPRPPVFASRDLAAAWIRGYQSATTREGR